MNLVLPPFYDGNHHSESASPHDIYDITPLIWLPVLLRWFSVSIRQCRPLQHAKLISINLEIDICRAMCLVYQPNSGYRGYCDSRLWTKNRLPRLLEAQLQGIYKKSVE